MKIIRIEFMVGKWIDDEKWLGSVVSDGFLEVLVCFRFRRIEI